MLLLGQLLIGSVRGQVICIPVGPCEQHATTHEASSCDHAGCAHHGESRHQSSTDHKHNAPEPSEHWRPDLMAPCECHLHVPLPEAPHYPATAEAAGGAQDLKPLFAASMIAVFACESGQTEFIGRPCAQLDITNSESRLSIKSIRLRI